MRRPYLLACICGFLCLRLAFVPPDAAPAAADAAPVFQAPAQGAIARPVVEKLSDMVSVKDFGAKGDGEADDTAAIQRAINGVSAAGGGTIFFPQGVYLIATRGSGPHGNIIAVKSNITFAGSGRGASEIRMKANTFKGDSYQLFSCFDNEVVAKMGAYRNINFRDLTINVNGSNGNAWNPANGPRVILQLGDTSNVTIERVDFLDTDVSNTISVGLGLDGARKTKNLRVSDCTFDNPTSGNPLSNDNSQILAMSDNAVISGNRFSNTTRQGRMLSTATELHGNNSAFTNNTISGMRQALYVCAEININPLLQNVVISGNTANDLNLFFATFWADPGREIRGVVISDNTVALRPMMAGTPVKTPDENSFFISAAWGTSPGTGVINQVYIHHNSATMMPIPAWSSGTYAVGDLRTNDRGNVYKCVVGGKSVSGPKGTGSNIADGGSGRWNYEFGFHANKSAVLTPMAISDWTISENYFKGFNYGVQHVNTTGLTIALENLHIRNNRFVDCATPKSPSTEANDIVVYIDNSTFSGKISNLILEGNRFLNSAAQARPIYVAAASAANYRISDNSMVNFTPTVAPVTLIGRPSTLAFADTQFYPRQAPSYGPAIAINAALGNEFVITPTNGAAFTISDPTNSMAGQRITIRVRNTIGVLGRLTFGPRYKTAAWTQPAKGYSRSIDFQFDGEYWIEASRTPADVPN